MAKLRKATHEGVVNIGETAMKVAVLEDGTRIINNSAIFRAFGRTKRGTQVDGSRVHNMPAFLNANNLQPFVGEDLRGVLSKVDYITLNGKEDNGYDASILPMLCKVYLDAREHKVLKTQQLALARASEILLIGLSKIGIIALVDEATGYQHEREKDELQKILKAYISADLLPWQKRFPDEFYTEIFRLNGWDYTVSGINKRPGVIGTWTKNLIYHLLPKGVLKELQQRTPKSAAGNKTARLHQGLTIDIGEPHLEKQLVAVITLMNVSSTWDEFQKLFIKRFYKELIVLPPQHKRIRTPHVPAEQTSMFDGIDPEILFPKTEEQVQEKPNEEPLDQFSKQLKGLLKVPPPKKDK